MEDISPEVVRDGVENGIARAMPSHAEICDAITEGVLGSAPTVTLIKEAITEGVRQAVAAHLDFTQPFTQSNEPH